MNAERGTQNAERATRVNPPRSVARRVVRCVVWALGCAFVTGPRGIFAQQPAVLAGVSISKDTVTVGEPFELRVRVRAPAGATIHFPDNPDSTGVVQARDPRTIITTDSVAAVDQTATYRLAAWDVGTQPVQIGNVTVVTGTAADEGRPVTLARMRVFVRSVLPADSALRVPKPARPLWEVQAFPWWILALLAAALAIGYGIWWWLKRRRRPKPVVVIDPWVRAQKEFTRLESMGLLDAGERTRFVALVVEVLRDYLAARYADATLALTSRELVSVMRRHPAVSAEQLGRLLHEADLAKFAAFSLSEERARTLARDARALVEQEHKATARPIATTSPETRAA